MGDHLRKRKRFEEGEAAAATTQGCMNGQQMLGFHAVSSSGGLSSLSLSSPCPPSPSYSFPVAPSPALDEQDGGEHHHQQHCRASGQRYLQHDDSIPTGLDASMDASFALLSEDESNSSFNTSISSAVSNASEVSTCSSSSYQHSLSCAEASISDRSAYDDRYAGDETPSDALHTGNDALDRSTSSLSNSLSNIHTAWGEESADCFGDQATPSGTSSMISSSYTTPSSTTSAASSAGSSYFEDFPSAGTGTWSTLSDDIYAEARRKELSTPPVEISPEYYKTRPILVDWMLDVGDYFGFHGATTHLAIAFLDRLLAVMIIERTKLQLVATTCLLIAAKLEEIPSKVPTVTEFNERTLDTYTPELIRTCERVVLLNLEWSLTITTPRSMLDFILSEVSCVSYDDLIRGAPLSYGKSREAEEWVIATAHHIMTTMVLDHRFLRFRPSILAAVCLAVARRQARIEPLWPERLERKTGLSLSDLAECFDFTWASTSAPAARPTQEAMET